MPHTGNSQRPSLRLASLATLLAAAVASPAAPAFTCPPAPGRALPSRFIGSWSAGIGSSRYYASGDALHTTIGVDVIDEASCMLDVLVSPDNARRAFITIGSASNPQGSRDVACALLDISAAPASVEFGLEFDITRCPLSTGLNYTGWTPGPPTTPIACPAPGAAIPAALLGAGSLTSQGFHSGSFLQLSAGAMVLVNEGALVTTWCAADVAPAGAPNVTQVDFRNSAAAAMAGGAAERAPTAAFSPGQGCVWLSAVSATQLAYKWGTLACPTNWTEAVTIPFNFSSSA